MDKAAIHEAWQFLREHNHTIPDEVLDFMRDAALEHESLLSQIEKLERERDIATANAKGWRTAFDHAPKKPSTR